jgi:anti-sigma regulatory factor (Ser/Thr protein kinase)
VRPNTPANGLVLPCSAASPRRAAPRPHPERLVRQAAGLAWEMFGMTGLPAWPPPGGPTVPLRVFGGTADQVRVVRQFVRGQLAGHPACDDAVVVASELGSNAVAHSASRLAGGRFVVHAARLWAGHAAVIVTDEGGPLVLPVPAGPDAETGRGLAVVRALSCWFRIRDHDGLRSFIAVVPAGSDVTAC